MIRDLTKWRGCFTAVVTPFKENGEIDKEAFCKNIELLIEEGINGVIVSGCTGESWALTYEEIRELFELGIKQSNGKIILIGGTGGQISAEKTIKLCQYANELGMDGVMILPPPIVIPNNREIFAFFESIGNSVDIPILLYNNPRRQIADLTPELIIKLADIKNVVAIKESSKDFHRVMEVLRLVGTKIRVFSGHSALHGVPAILMGAAGWVGSSDTQVMGKEAIQMFSYAEKGDIDKARQIQFRCISLAKGLAVGSGTASLKYAMKLRKRPGGYPRKPILPLTEQEEQHVRTSLLELSLI